MTEKTTPRGLFWRPDAREIAAMALIAVFVLVGKSLIRMPIKVPGHAGVLWVAALIIGRAAVRKPGAGLFMGLIGGVLIALMTPSQAGPLFTVAKYAVCGLVLDLLAPAFESRFDRILPAVVAGAAALAGKVVVDVLQEVVTGVPAAYIAAGLTVTAIAHIGFGALGGLSAALVLKALRRAHLPQFRDLEDEEGVA
jgi:hypothetical protein